MNKEICLIGNPNCGKTSLFNSLTGTYQKVGNWTGVTTEKKEGKYKNNKSIKIIDLPGTYTLKAQSKDESNVLDYLKNNKPFAIINVVDGTNLERNLYLSSELIYLGVPVIIAINYYDELLKNKINVNVNKIEELFGVKCVFISAKKNINIETLIDYTLNLNMPTDEGFFKMGDLAYNRTIVKSKINQIIQREQTKSEIITQKIDKVITSKTLGIPIFIGVILLVYFLSSKVGGFFSGYISSFFLNLSIRTQENLLNIGVSGWLVSLLTKAVLQGVGSVLSFSPQILVLFFCMTIIEESGYATRISFILDRIFRFFGLGGKSVIPIILSCGCSVTGIMATRTIENDYERKSTIFLAPFMPCGAKMAVFAWFSYLFFNGNPLIATSMYFIGILSVCFFGVVLKKIFKNKQKNSFYLIEMPTLRMPSATNILRVLWEKLKDFTYKSGTIIFAVSIILWFLSSFGIYGYTTVVENSFLYNIGNIIKYIFYPLGFGSWQASVSVLTGLFAKEAVIETLEIISIKPSLLFDNKFAIYAFMTFVLLSPPCSAAISSAKQELNSKKSLLFMLVFQFLSAYLVALIIRIVGIISSLSNGLIFSILIAIILLILSVFIIIRRIRKGKCNNCSFCYKGKKCQIK